MCKKILLSLLCISCFCFVGCGATTETATENPPVEVEDTEAEVEDIEAYPEAEEPAIENDTTDAAEGHVSSYGQERERKDGMVRSYLTGKFVPEEIGDHRPIALMLNNIEDAMPMSGVSYADVLYECVVEGSITRMMGIFENYKDLEKMGSVRSCRNYFVYYALEYDAIYAHFGQSAYAVPLLEKDFVDNLSGLSSIGDIVFYRSSDRVAPHNAYASGKGIDEGIKRMEYDTAYSPNYTGKFTFAYDDETIVPDVNSYDAKTIKPGYLINAPWFEYNEEDHKYYRFQYGVPHIDDLTGEQLSFDNIIFQYSQWQQIDDKGYLGFDCHAGGKMTYFTQGKAEDGVWVRYDGDEGATRYYDAEGKEIIVNQGKTMICIIQDTLGDKVEIQ